MYYETLIDVVKALIVSSEDEYGVAPYQVTEMGSELVNEESVAALVPRVQVQPQVLIAIGDAESTGNDSSGRVSDESIPVEMVVAVSDSRSENIQVRLARRLVFDLRRRLQGRRFSMEGFAQAAFLFETTEHIGTTPGLTLYSVIFRVAGAFDIDAAPLD